MARYGQFKYSQAKYGVTPVTGLLKWSVEVDWDQDHAFDGSNEARRMFGISTFRGRRQMLKSTGSGFQTISPGKCTIKLRNNDGRYDGWSQTSPLYPYVTYGPEVRIRVTNQETGDRRHVFSGAITDIQPHGYGGDAYVVVEIEDYSRLLRSNRARTPITAGLTPGEAINAILNAVNWPTRWGRNIDTGTGTMNYHWASGSKLAWSELEDVAMSFLGLFFISADGKAKFIDRNTEPASVLELTQAVLLKDINNPQPFVNRRNVTRLKVHPRKQTETNVVIYQVIGDPLLVEAGSSRTIWSANYSYDGQSVPATDVQTPISGTDYEAFQNSDGTGTDLTANCTMTVTDFGDNAKIVFRNTGGTNFYVTKRQIQGKAIYEENTDDITYPEDVSDVTDPREFLLDMRWQQSVNVANDYALVLGRFLDQLHPFPTVKMQGRPDYQFVPDLFDVAALDLEKLNVIGRSFRFGGIEHKSLSETCQDVATKFFLEPYITSGDYWTWPVDDFGTDTVFGVG